MPNIPRDDPYGGYNFEVSILGLGSKDLVKASFSEVSGLEVALDPIDYRTGSEDIRARKLPGLKKFTNIVLKRGTTADVAFWNWILSGMKGAVERVEGSISLLDETRTKQVLTWKFKRAWACKWTGPGLNAKNNEIALETVEICHEGLSIDGEA